MFKYQAYLDRVKPDGISFQTDIQSSSKRQAHELIMNSPSLSSVGLMKLDKEENGTYSVKLDETIPSLVSEVDSFYKRSALFLPDKLVELGSYLDYKGHTHLVTKVRGDDIYPQVELEFCNFDVLIEVEKERVVVGKDPQGRPIYDYVGQDYRIPAVATSKIYSTLDNSQIPLPVGAMYLYIPYHKDIEIPVNYEYEMYGDSYQVTTVSKINLLRDSDGELYGFLELRGQRIDGRKEVGAGGQY